MAEQTTDRQARTTEYRRHEKTYYGFLHMAKWFLVHAALILIGLFVAFGQNATFAGWLFIGAGVAALFYGVATTAGAAERAVRRRNRS